MNRRRAVALGGLVVLVVLAGCHAAGSLDMERAGDEEIADAASREAELDQQRETEQMRIVVAAIENGSTTATSTSPAVRPGLPFERNGTYYNVSWAVVGTANATSAEFTVDENGTVPEGEAVAYESLSARDREAIDSLLGRNASADLVVSVTYNDTERERSALLSGEYAGVRHQGETYAVDVVDRERETQRIYRYTATPVATSTASYAEELRERYLFTLSGLSPAEREVVESAINDTYYADDSNDDAFRAVLERFRTHPAIRETEHGGTWLVRYEGEVYRADLDYGGFETV